MDLEYKASDASVWERSTSMLVPDESGSKKQARSPHEVRTIAWALATLHEDPTVRDFAGILSTRSFQGLIKAVG